MKVEYNNLYTHFVFTTFLREPVILNSIRERVEKYITGIVNNNGCHLYANPEHVHFLVSRVADLDEERLACIVENSSTNFINKNKLCKCNFQWQMSCSAFSVSKQEIDHV
jgi:REP element-mobilizing transposase RayT